MENKKESIIKRDAATLLWKAPFLKERILQDLEDELRTFFMGEAIDPGKENQVLRHIVEEGKSVINDNKETVYCLTKGYPNQNASLEFQVAWERIIVTHIQGEKETHHPLVEYMINLVENNKIAYLEIDNSAEVLAKRTYHALMKEGKYPETVHSFIDGVQLGTENPDLERTLRHQINRQTYQGPGEWDRCYDNIAEKYGFTQDHNHNYVRRFFGPKIEEATDSLRRNQSIMIP